MSLRGASARMRILVLNATHEPLSTTTALRALSMVVSGKATPVKLSETTLRYATVHCLDEMHRRGQHTLTPPC
jgi:hypothetical protein